VNKKRPVNLNLMTIQFPITAIISILHRLSGVLLFLAIPLLLWMFQRSLQSAYDFHQLRALLQTPLVSIFLWFLLSALFYHLLAGIRHLVMDTGVGDSLAHGRLGAKIVLALAIIMAIMIGVWLW